MFNYKVLIRIKLIFLLIFFSNFTLADNHNLNEVLELIQKDLKTLEKAVYSESNNKNNIDSQKNFDGNSEDILTRHLLKLSEIENQFKENINLNMFCLTLSQTCRIMLQNCHFYFLTALLCFHVKVLFRCLYILPS